MAHKLQMQLKINEKKKAKPHIKVSFFMGLD